MDKRMKTILKWSIIVLILIILVFGNKTIALGFFVLIMIVRDIVRIYRISRKR